MRVENDPVVAERMNALPKVVFSRTLGEAGWSNTRLVKGDLVGEVRRMKSQDGPHIAILGSGSLVAQLASAGLVDEFQVVVNPVAIGRGRTMFEGTEGFEGIAGPGGVEAGEDSGVWEWRRGFVVRASEMIALAESGLTA